jgi:hypothetical protein
MEGQSLATSIFRRIGGPVAFNELANSHAPDASTPQPSPARFVETTSPRERPILVRERACRTVRVEEREAHGLTCRLLDGARALEVIEVRRGEAGARSVDLDACRLEFQGEGERDRVEGGLRRAVNDGDPAHARRMVALLADGLRYGASNRSSHRGQPMNRS